MKLIYESWFPNWKISCYELIMEENEDYVSDATDF